mmetsp:Transcript_16058/g.22375  ORF Transcript_16058/g.22375 Transcript_16058/m.22375 type:complete len:105 (-) Transcript_16058:343-657(-)
MIPDLFCGNLGDGRLIGDNDFVRGRGGDDAFDAPVFSDDDFVRGRGRGDGLGVPVREAAGDVVVVVVVVGGDAEPVTESLFSKGVVEERVPEDLVMYISEDSIK